MVNDSEIVFNEHADKLNAIIKILLVSMPFKQLKYMLFNTAVMSV